MRCQKGLAYLLLSEWRLQVLVDSERRIPTVEDPKARPSLVVGVDDFLHVSRDVHVQSRRSLGRRADNTATMTSGRKLDEHQIWNIKCCGEPNSLFFRE